MPVVRPYPIGEVSPQPLPNAQPNVPAAGDAALFGGTQARDLQVAGQQLGQASDTVFALYERHATQANDNGVQDLNNRFIDGSREILRTGPDAYYSRKGADAIAGAGTATERLTTLKDQLLGQAPNDYQRQRLGPILDAHLAASADGIARYADGQRAVYGRTVAAAAVGTSRADAVADPGNLPNAMLRAEGATRFLYQGQAPEVIEGEVRRAGGSVVSAVIGDRLAHDDPSGVALFGHYGDRLDPSDRRRLGAAAEMLSNTIAAAAWVHDRSARLAADKAIAPTGDPALDAVNAATASTAELPPVTSAGGVLLNQGGVAGYGQRMADIEDRRRALTALNEREFAGNPARLRTNRAAIDTDSARERAAVRADADKAYADLQAHLTTGGPGGGPAVALPPATLLSRFTAEQQASIARQVDRSIEGRKTATDPQTWYAIQQGLTGDDATERARWADTNLVQFRGQLSEEDSGKLATLQAEVRNNDGGAEQSRLQMITRMANRALRAIAIDPTPRADSSPNSDAAQAVTFHRALQDELSAFESSKGRKTTAVEAQDVIDRLVTTAFKGGWFKVDNRNEFLVKVGDIPDGVLQSDAEVPAPAAGQDRITVIDVPTDPESYKRFLAEYRQRNAAEQAAAGTGGAPGAPATEPDSSSPEYRAADAQARKIVAEQGGNPSEVQRAETSPRPTSRGASMAVPMAPEWLPSSAVLGKLADAVAQATRSAASWAVRAAPAAAGLTAGAAAEVFGGALTLIVIPTNSQAELHPIGENLRVRTAPDQRSATVEQRVDGGLFGTGVGAKWIDLEVGAAWAYDRGRRYVAIDRRGLEQAIGRDAADAALGGNGIAMAKPPSKDGSDEGNKPGSGHNSESFSEKLTPESRDEEPEPPLNPTPLVLPAIDGAKEPRIVEGDDIKVPAVNAPGEGYKDFDTFKRKQGYAGAGYAWHHIVTQHADNIKAFGATAIHNTNNLVRLPAELHDKISGFYASKPLFTGGVRVQDWVRQMKSFEEQATYGREVIEKFRRSGNE